MAGRRLYVLAAVLFFAAAVLSVFTPGLGLAFSVMWAALGALFLILGLSGRGT